MSPTNFDGDDNAADGQFFAQMDSVEFLLFDSLIHHLIEKGLFTKSDALSVVQTVAHVVRGYLNDDLGAARARAELSKLERTYASFDAMSERTGRSVLNCDNVRQLRPPLHSDRPEFPLDD